MTYFKCPNCGQALEEQERSYVCSKGHQFDRAKSGYVNLLMSQKDKMKQHGDDKLMVRARREFLDKGYYGLLLDQIKNVFDRFSSNHILDAGCGECWYTESLLKSGRTVYGVDISKNAVDLGSKRNSDLMLAVGSTFDLPIIDDSFDACLSVFAPFKIEEIFRVLKDDGIFVQVFPLANHLMELKEIVYDHPYANDVDVKMYEGFQLLDVMQIKGPIEITSTEDILNVFKMTPYAHRTPKENIERLTKYSYLNVGLEFGLAIYRKEKL